MAPVAFFSRANGLTELFQRTVLRAAVPVCLPYFAQEARGGEDVRNGYLRVVSYLTAIGWPFFVFLAVMAFPAIRILYGSQWIESVPLARVLCVAAAIEVAYLLTKKVLISKGEVKVANYLQAMMQITRVVGLLAVIPFGLIGACWGLLAAALVGGVWSHRILATRISLTFRQVLGEQYVYVCCRADETVLLYTCPASSTSTSGPRTIKQGRCYVSDGRSCIMDCEVNSHGVGLKKSEVETGAAGTVKVKANVTALLEPKPTPETERIRNTPLHLKPYWDVDPRRLGDSRKVPVELVVNGFPVAKKEIDADGAGRLGGFVPHREGPVAGSLLRIFPSRPHESDLRDRQHQADPGQQAFRGVVPAGDRRKLLEGEIAAHPRERTPPPRRRPTTSPAGTRRSARERSPVALVSPTRKF